MRRDLNEVLWEGARELGVELSEEKVKALEFFLEELMRWNRKMNLTSIRRPFEIVVKHFLDSLAGSSYLFPAGNILWRGMETRPGHREKV